MLPVSQGFLDALDTSHKMVAWLESIDRTGNVRELPVSSFSVTVDSTSQCRRTLTAEIPGRQWIPSGPYDELQTNGQRLRAFRGIEHTDGSVEAFPLGVFRIDSWSANPVIGTVEVAASSLECLLADDRFDTPRTYSAPSVQGLIGALVKETAPDETFRVTTNRDARVISITVDEDRLGLIRQLAKSIGCDFRTDAYGRFELRDTATLEDEIAWYIGPGRCLVSSRSTGSRDGVYNAVTVRGENAADAAEDSPPITASAVDNNKDSPTYYYGPWGKKRRFYSSPLISTTDQAQLAAYSILARSVGAAETLSLDSITNPALDDGDILSFGSGSYIVDKFTIGSAPTDGMTIDTRSMRGDDLDG